MMREEEEIEENFVEEAEDLFYCLQEEEDDSVVIKRELKYATFEYNETDKTITIETKSDATPPIGHVETDEEYAERVANSDAPVNGRIKLNSVYSFALLRFVIRIAQRNWFRKIKK
tara:strand:- start:28174 stop:28521 length:348 start_codon:yes stop_codon:yes gene_type:complete